MHTDCKYITEKERYGRMEKVLDVRAFATDLAAQLGATMIPPNANQIGDDTRWYASFALDGAEISITKAHNAEHTGKVTVRAKPLNLEIAHNDQPRNRDEYALPEAGVSVLRPIAQIAKDVTRRVIEPSKAPIAKRREHAAALIARRDGIAETAKRMSLGFPGLSVRHEPNADTASLYYNDSGAAPYLSGRINADCSISIERIGSLTPEQFKRVWAALYATKGK